MEEQRTDRNKPCIHTERKPVKPDQSNWNDLTNIQLHVLLIIEMSKTVQQYNIDPAAICSVMGVQRQDATSTPGLYAIRARLACIL